MAIALYIIAALAAIGGVIGAASLGDISSYEWRSMGYVSGMKGAAVLAVLLSGGAIATLFAGVGKAVSDIEGVKERLLQQDPPAEARAPARSSARTCAACGESVLPSAGHCPECNAPM